MEILCAYLRVINKTLFRAGMILFRVGPFVLNTDGCVRTYVRCARAPQDKEETRRWTSDCEINACDVTVTGSVCIIENYRYISERVTIVNSSKF